jgi:hypothetical protein
MDLFTCYSSGMLRNKSRCQMVSMTVEIVSDPMSDKRFYPWVKEKHLNQAPGCWILLENIFAVIY